MAEALTVQRGEFIDWTADGTYYNGDVIQVPDGRAGIVRADCTSGQIIAVEVTQGLIVELPKTASIAILPGIEVHWDHSANKAHYKSVNDRDFYVGVCVEDSAGTATTVTLALNTKPKYRIDAMRDGCLSVPTGTAAAGGFGYPVNIGGAAQLELTATSEAQCVDLLSVDRVAIVSNPIAEIIIRPAANGSGAAVDASFGLANGTSTTDADAVTEHVFFHIDGGSTAINAQSKDGTTTVTATDTTKTISAGTAVANRTYLWIDARLPADVQLYVDGVNVLTSTVFKLDAGTGPIGLLAHLEKTTGTTTGKFIVDAMRLWTSQI